MSNARSGRPSRSSSRTSQHHNEDVPPPDQEHQGVPPREEEDPDGIHSAASTPRRSPRHSRSRSASRNSEQTNRSQSRTGSRQSRTGSRPSRKPSKKDVRIVDTHSQEEVDAAVLYITKSHLKESMLPILEQAAVGNGFSIDVVQLADNIKHQIAAEVASLNIPPAPSAPPPHNPNYDEHRKDTDKPKLTGRPNRFQHIQRNSNPIDEVPDDFQRSFKNMMLKLKFKDRSTQRQLIAPPDNFVQGDSALLSNPHQMNENTQAKFQSAKFYYPSAFAGGLKFKGKKSSDGFGILELLLAMQNGHRSMPVTESEFLYFIVSSMQGKPQQYMQSLYDMYLRGETSIEDIYLDLTDTYFTDLTPKEAKAKLLELNEYNHDYGSLSEAHHGLLHLSNLASLSSRSEHCQTAISADLYQQALLKIIPRDYRVAAITAMEYAGNLKGEDLTPHQSLSCLSEIRRQIDETLRSTLKNRLKNKKDDRKDDKRNGKVKQIQKQRHSPPRRQKSPAPRPKQPQRQDNRPRAQIRVVQKDNAHPSQNQRDSHKTSRSSSRPPARQKSTSDNRGSQRDRSQSKDRKVRITKSDSKPGKGCQLCGNTAHKSDNCPFYPTEGKMPVATFACNICNIGLHHYSRDCNSKKASKN